MDGPLLGLGEYMSDMNQRDLAFRQVHLDFHTSPLIPDVGAEFDPKEFASVLKEARVNSVTCFAKCHHGMSYYDTRVGIRHPSLTFDLLRAQIEACHAEGIRVPIYYSVVWENWMGEMHPEWQQLRRNGQPCGPEPFQPGWKWMCLNTPYVDYVAAQTQELLASYPFDGMFYDIVFQNDPGCYCRYCFDSMKRMGLDPASDEDQRKHSAYVVHRFMERMSSMIRAKAPDATIFYNGRIRMPFSAEAPHMTHAEIEALPTGGWGYGYYPFWVRYVRNYGMPTLGMTGRFHRSWADFGGLKSPAQLHYECSSMLANTSQCSIGDQLHPRGRLDRAVYDVIGEAYRAVEAKEPWCRGAVPVAELALLVLGEKTDADDGASKMLLEMHRQYDVIDAEADFSRYGLLVIADKGRPTPELVEKLRSYLAAGGKLILSHTALLDEAKGDFAVADEMGVHYAGPADTVPDFFRVGPAISHGIRGFEYVLYDGSTMVTPEPDTEVLADAYVSYFSRTWEHFTSHGYSPVKEKAQYPAVTKRGAVIYLYGPFFGAYHRHGNTVYRKVVENCLDLLLPDRLVETDAPSTAEVTVTRQKNRCVVHIVNYHAQRRANHVEVIEEVIPLRDVSVSLRLEEEPSRAYLAPENIPLDVSHADGVARVLVPRVNEHAMVVFET